MARDPINIFIAGHESDEEYALRLYEHTFGAKSAMPHVMIKPRKPSGGEDINAFIERELGDSHFIILLVSTKFFIYSENYWKKALEIHQSPMSNCRIVPILARSFDYDDWLRKDFPTTEMFTFKGKPLYHWKDDDEPYQCFTQMLFELINKTEKSNAPKERSAKEQKKFAHLLTRLNYTEQPLQFQQAQLLSKGRFTSNKAFAYLIRGAKGFGQEWLYYILRQKIKDPAVWEELEEIEDITYDEIPLSFSSLTIKTDPNAIWGSLGKTLRISSQASAEQVVNDICNERAKTKIVVFRFEDFGEWTQDMGKQFMETFWQAIVDGMANPSDGDIRYPIFLFLIDHNSANSICGNTFLPGHSRDWNPKKGVSLKELDHLSFDTIKSWFEKNQIQFNQFDPELIFTLADAEKVKALTNEILKDTNGGQPDIVLEKISRKLNFHFFDIQDQLAENE